MLALRFASPSERLHALTREFIDALEADKAKLAAEVQRLQAKVDELGPENARLRESLSNAESNNTFTTILIVVGGFAVSYATFTGNSAQMWANAALGCLLAGVALLVWQTWRRR